MIIDPIPTGPSPSFQTLPSSKRTICTMQTTVAEAGRAPIVCSGWLELVGAAIEWLTGMPGANSPTLSSVRLPVVRPIASTISKRKRTSVAARWLTFVKSTSSENASPLGIFCSVTTHRSIAMGATLCGIVVSMAVDAPASNGTDTIAAMQSHSLLGDTATKL